MFKKISVATKIVIFATVLLGCFMLINAQSPKVSTAPTIDFTYQGKLNTGTVAANGTYDFKFDIYDAETNGSIVQTIIATGVTVTNGIFTVKLVVNPTTFNGDERFLEIWATNSGTFGSPMTPRQKVTFSPYAVRAKDAENAGNAINAGNANSLGGVAANNYVQTNDARLTDARTPTAGSGDYIQNGTTVQTANFNIDGIAKAGSVDTASEYKIGGNTVVKTINNTQNTFIGIRAGFGITSGIDNTFVGQASGSGNTTGSSNTFIGIVSGLRNISGQQNTYLGGSSGFDNLTGSFNTFVGQNAGRDNTGSNNTALGRNADVGVNAQYSTAIGAGTINGSFNSVKLGRDGLDRVKIGKLDSAGATSVCLNTSNALATCSSSIRYKQNIQTSQFGLDLIKRLRPVTFNWKGDNKADFGLVAEEVNAVEPLLTITNKDGEVEGVKYDRVGVVLVNAVNEQQTQIEAQQKEIERLKSELDSLKKLICAGNEKAEICKPKEQQ